MSVSHTQNVQVNQSDKAVVLEHDVWGAHETDHNEEGKEAHQTFTDWITTGRQDSSTSWTPVVELLEVLNTAG